MGGRPPLPASRPGDTGLSRYMLLLPTGLLPLQTVSTAVPRKLGTPDPAALTLAGTHLGAGPAESSPRSLQWFLDTHSLWLLLVSIAELG